MLELAQGDTLFRLRVVGYQFPHLKRAGSDSNWLMIWMSATCPQGSWETTDPMLDTYEVRRLASWFDQVALGTPAQRWKDFTEPNLTFCHMGSDQDGSHLRIYFSHEARPPWASRHPEQRDPVDNFEVEAQGYLASGLNTSFITLAVPKEQLREAAAYLRSALERWPTRS